MSPRNLQVTTMCDELRISNNYQSKVVGIAIKDRGGILPAGHTANAAYWYDGSTGNWVSSTYYMQQLPDWVDALQSRFQQLHIALQRDTAQLSTHALEKVLSR
jgi:hypothetical protein